MEKVKQGADELGRERLAASQREWAELISNVKAEMEKGADPSDPVVKKLARQWMSLVREFTRDDPGIRESLGKMWK